MSQPKELKPRHIPGEPKPPRRSPLDKGIRRKRGEAYSKEWITSRVSIQADGCWRWTSSITRNGYARQGTIRIHRLAYRLWKGEIPANYYVDHLCRNRACVNPDHLEPVTARENQLRGHSFAGLNARKTHCKYGHALTEKDVIISTPSRIKRKCKQCKLIAGRNFYAKRKARAALAQAKGGE